MGKRRARRSRSLRRRGPTQDPRATLLIVCEGEKTEPQYFLSLCETLRLATVRVAGKECGNAPISVVDYAVDEKKKRKRAQRGAGDPYDAVWCVMDVEGAQGHESLKRALDKARRNGLETVLSNPCFEYWCLLHLEESGRPFRDCDEVIKRLQKSFPQYSKGQSFYGELKDKTEDALRRAERMLKNHPDDRVSRNPSTEVYRLVKRLRDIASKAHS